MPRWADDSCRLKLLSRLCLVSRRSKSNGKFTNEFGTYRKDPKEVKLKILEK